MISYSLRLYNLPPGVLESLKRVEPWRLYVSFALAWVAIYGLVRAYLYVGSWWLFVPTIFLIAGRAGVFLQLAHEVAHGLGPRWFGNLASYCLGFDLKGYADGHMRHHACANRACDPVSDREKYRVCDPRDWRLWALLAKDASGWTAISTRIKYGGMGSGEVDSGGYEEIDDGYRRAGPSPQSRALLAANLMGIAATQSVVLIIIFQMSPLHYLTLWLLPLTTAHMVLMRIRGIAEHGLSAQLGITMADHEGIRNGGTFYTRSFGTPLRRWWRPVCWLERALIGSLAVYYHHEHHLAPKVPYYNLARLHALIGVQVQGNNRHVYIRGYFAGMWEALWVR